MEYRHTGIPGATPINPLSSWRGHYSQPGTYTRMTWCSRYRDPYRGCAIFEAKASTAAFLVESPSKRTAPEEQILDAHFAHIRLQLRSFRDGLVVVVPRSRRYSS